MCQDAPVQQGDGDTPHRADRATFVRAKRVRSFDDVVEQVRRSIADGAISAGQRLPSEREMAEQFGVSRATLREALRALEALGILEIRLGARGGAFAVEQSSERLATPLRELLAVEATQSPEDTRLFRATFHSDNVRWARLTDQAAKELTAKTRIGEREFLVALGEATQVPLRRILTEAVETVYNWSTTSGSLTVTDTKRVLELMRSDRRDEAAALLFKLLTK